MLDEGMNERMEGGCSDSECDASRCDVMSCDVM